eukprot:CAMPEP_0184311642 /NCGR_PEP_ID=MMETSP1049-20130417/43458_1 /TAXON_ID=77928 /ORGANISM="Proteomonas sulcata, Strain CCMP704" /LENGTH=67 /DNA_ID=CAMNT_0026627183 /DNA_START=279 /DNA_END=479 /DNA_ORIENTATION=+
MNLVPVGLKYSTLFKASGGPSQYENENPRSMVANLKAKGKIDAKTEEYCQRLTGAEANGYEINPFFW